MDISYSNHMEKVPIDQFENFLLTRFNCLERIEDDLKIKLIINAKESTISFEKINGVNAEIIKKLISQTKYVKFENDEILPFWDFIILINSFKNLERDNIKFAIFQQGNKNIFVLHSYEKSIEELKERAQRLEKLSCYKYFFYPEDFKEYQCPISICRLHLCK